MAAFGKDGALVWLHRQLPLQLVLQAFAKFISLLRKVHLFLAQQRSFRRYPKLTLHFCTPGSEPLVLLADLLALMLKPAGGLLQHERLVIRTRSLQLPLCFCLCLQTRH